MTHAESEILEGAAKQVPPGGTVVELGCLHGAGSSRAIGRGLAHAGNRARHICIDLWDESFYARRPDKMPRLRKRFGNLTLLQMFESNMRAYPHVTMRMDSVPAAREFADGTVDMIFIDSDHSYEHVRDELKVWLPKMKPGAVMHGHDYWDEEPGVIKAVNEVFKVVDNPTRCLWVAATAPENIKEDRP